MSELINAIDFNDPLIHEIREQVSAKNDNTPFLLLPVKIETRFMKVDRPVDKDDSFTDVLGGLFELEDYLRFKPESLPDHEVIGRMRKLQKQFTGLTAKAEEIRHLSGFEKELLQSRVVHLENEQKKLFNRIREVQWSDRENLKQLRSLKTSMSNSMRLACNRINELQSTEETLYKETMTLIGALQNVKDALANLGSKDLTTKNRNEKRALFSFIESLMEEIEHSLSTAETDVNRSMLPNEGHLGQLGELEAETSWHLNIAEKNLKKLKSVFKKAEYLEKINIIDQQTKDLYLEINNKVIPRMKMRRDLKMISTREVINEINKVRYKLKTLNQHPFKNYQEITSTKENLYKDLKGIRGSVFNLIEGSEIERKALNSAWDEVDFQLQRFTDRLRALNSQGPQKVGVKRIISHIESEYRAGLAGLKSGAKSYFTTLTNSKLESNSQVFKKTIDTLKIIDEVVNENITKPNSKKLREALNDLIRFKKSFSVASRDLQVLPQKYHKELTKISEKLTDNTEKIVAAHDPGSHTASKKLAIEAAQAMGSINTLIRSKPTDSISRRKALEDEVRSPIIFAAKTVTQDELWVRIYPDDIAIHSHEEALTQEEVDAGKAYWYEIWAANEDYETMLAAWRAISTAYGSQRAAWIVRALEVQTTEAESIKRRFQPYSKSLNRVNGNLKKICDLFARVKDPEHILRSFGEAFPLLNLVEKDMTNVRKGHINLVQKTQRLLLKVQSQVNGLSKRLVASSESSDIFRNGNMSVVEQFVGIFNHVVVTFQSISKVNSRELIKDEETASDPFPEIVTKDSDWTQAPHSRVMPDRFVVVTKRGDHYRHVVVSETLPTDKLVVGLDPETFETDAFQYDEDGNLIADENIKWLIDFEEAKRKGMALSIALDKKDVKKGFDKLYVVGVKSTTSQEGKQLIEQLIDNHHYLPEGASFLPISTPTNNTEAGASGYRTFEEDAALSFAVERNNESSSVPIVDADFPTDGQRLAEALGLNPEVFDNLDYQDRTEISEALLMNRALFHGTLGNYLEEGLDTLFTLDNINHTKEFFSNYVSARGYLPCIRTGTQPYGILATTAFSQFQVTANDDLIPILEKEDFNVIEDIGEELQTRYDIRLKQFLQHLQSLWTDIRNNAAKPVPHAGNTDPDDPQAHFMQMLGLQASSEEYYYRYGLNIASRQGATEVSDFSINFNADDPWSPSNLNLIFRDLVNTGYYFKSDRFHDEYSEFTDPSELQNIKYSRIATQFSKARVFVTRHLDKQSKILGDQIDNRELAEAVTEASNPVAGTAEENLEAQAELQYFIDWLIDSNPWDVHAENQFSTISEDALVEKLPSKSLLFLILRHSILSAHADTILKILEAENLTDQRTRKMMGQPDHFYNRLGSGFNYVTKWTYLFSKIDRLNFVLGFPMDEDNPFFNYMNTRSGNNGYLNRYISPEHPNVFFQYQGRSLHQPFVDELNQTREAIRKLKDIPTKRLGEMLAEHFDLCTYRLDAWQLGMVNKRLSNQRKQNASGLYLGAYGWVENLRKGGDRELAEHIPETLWKNGDEPVFTDEDNLGFIHTPSLNHAITAAILRAGFDANADTAEVENQMAVNLSSARIRSALTLLNGIRNGQDAAAILGYQFERGLHERYLHVPLELDEYIYDFRDEFPLTVAVDDAVSLGESNRNNVVNGIELLETAQDFIDDQGGPPNLENSIYQNLKSFGDTWWDHIGNANISSASIAKKDAILKEIDRMADVFDAFSDLCISDSVYQVVRGNHIRAAAIMDKLAKGDVPNDIEIADTPRTGTVVTHKVGYFFETISGIDHELGLAGLNSAPLEGEALAAMVISTGARPLGWESEFTPRALAEPTLNKWVGGMIGNPSNIKCQVTYSIAETTDALTVTLADLELQPLDVLHLFGTGPLDGGAELNQRIAKKVKNTILIPAGFEGTPDDAVIELKYTTRDDSWNISDFSFYEMAGYLQSIRTFITSSAALAADDLLIPGQEEVEPNSIRNQNLTELTVRISNLNARLEAIQADWETFFIDEISLDQAEDHTFTNGQIDQMRSLLLRSSLFGIPGTIPENLFTFGNEAGDSLINASDGAAKAINQRLKQASKHLKIANDESRSNDTRVRAVQDAGKQLIGKAFVMLPHFKLRNPEDINLQLTLGPDLGLLRDAPPGAMDSWSHGLGRVRERMAGMETVQMWAENFEFEFPSGQPVQFPFALSEAGVSVDPWLGIEFREDYQPSEDKLSIVLINFTEVVSDPDILNSAFLVDEWVEIIPSLNETTGITFNYDQPDAKAPNNLLLAVTPHETGNWQWDELVYTLEDTLEIAKNRAVEPEHLEETVFGQVLPAIMTEVVPPQLLPDEGDDDADPQENPLGLQVVTDFGVVNETYDEEIEE